nr:uncharacterized protein LOC124499903 [Dermatophagoides farinae]
MATIVNQEMEQPRPSTSKELNHGSMVEIDLSNENKNDVDQSMDGQSEPEPEIVFEPIAETADDDSTENRYCHYLNSIWISINPLFISLARFFRRYINATINWFLYRFGQNGDDDREKIIPDKANVVLSIYDTHFYKIPKAILKQPKQSSNDHCEPNKIASSSSTSSSSDSSVYTTVIGDVKNEIEIHHAEDSSTDQGSLGAKAISILQDALREIRDYDINDNNDQAVVVNDTKKMMMMMMMMVMAIK